MILCLGTTPALQRVMVFKAVAVDAVNRAVEVHESSAGKGINVARVLAQLGEPVMAVGFAGGGRGDQLLADLDASSVPHDFVRVSPPTRLCTTVIDRGSGAVTELVEESRAVEAGAYERLLDRLRAHLPGAAMLTLSGSLTPGGPEDFYRTCVELARRSGVPVMVDAQGTPLLRALEARPNLVKPNRAELAATTGRVVDSDDDLRRAMSELIERGAGAAVVTMGAEGAAATDGRDFWRVRVPAAEADNPIGSGDAFTAGLASGLTRGAALSDACRLASACGVANAMQVLAGHIDVSDVRRIEGEIRVERF